MLPYFLAFVLVIVFGTIAALGVGFSLIIIIEAVSRQEEERALSKSNKTGAPKE